MAIPTGPIRPETFVPASEYRDPGLPAIERERLWPRVWQMAIRESELRDTGDFVAYEILDESILIIRTGSEPDDITALYNVCQHRGRRLVDRPRGRLGQDIPCRFHGWRFELTGALKHVTFAEDFEGCTFDRDGLAIPRLKVGRWGGWIWINQDETSEPLETWLAEVDQALAPFDFAAMRPLWWKTVRAPVNWKIVVEAFNEGYHSGETHTSGINYRQLRSPTEVRGPHALFHTAPSPYSAYRLGDATGWTLPESFQEHLWANNAHLFNTLFALTLAPGMRASERVRALPEGIPPEDVIAAFHASNREEIEKTGAAFPAALTVERWLAAGTDWHIFPNSIVLPSLDGALWYRLRPDAANDGACIFDIWSFGRFAPGQEPTVKQEIFEGFEAFKGVCPFLEEDFLNLQAVDRGVKSRGFRGATTNPVQEATITHFHEMLRSFRK